VTAGGANGAAVADVGGTRGRFAVLGAASRPGPAVELACADYPDMEALLRAGLARLGLPRPGALALAIAAPVLGDAVALTNLDWRFSQGELARALGIGRLLVLNDFAAQALALPQLRPADLLALGPPRAASEGTKAVLGPGTGLGVAGLARGNGGWTVLSGEGGHVDFAPQDERQAAVWRALARRFGHVSLERILSGPGLVNLYRALAETDGLPAPLDHPAGLLAADAPAPAAEALRLFARLLGQAAGDLALTLGATGGVYLSGGVVPAMGAAFDAASFRAGFTAKGRFAAYLDALSTWLVRHPQPALLGLAARLAEPE